MNKFAIIITLLVVSFAPGCDRYLESRDPVRSEPTPISIPTNMMAVVDDGSVTLSWELTDSTGAALFRVYAAESEEGEYLLTDSTPDFNVTLIDLLLNRQTFLRVTTVTSGDVESEPSLTVSAAPTHFSIVINDDTEYTMQRDVQVRINTGVTALFLQVSEQVDFGDANWESFGASRSFELSEDDGVKTVYVRLQFADGSETGQPLSDEITLDTYAEIESLTFFPNAAILAIDSVTTFRMQTAEAGGEASVSFGSVSDLELYDDATNGDAIADDGIYTLVYTVPYGAYAFDEVVTGSFTDEAGNRSEDFIAETLMNINSPPQAVTLAADSVADMVGLTWTTSRADDFESYRLYQNAQPSVDTADNLIAIFTSSGTAEYETNYPLNTTYYRLFVFDRHGVAVGSNEVQVP